MNKAVEAKKLILFILISVLTACSITPQHLTTNERYTEAMQTMSSLAIISPDKTDYIDYYDAIIRSVKHNLDYRVKMANLALEAGKLDVALYAMFPNLNVSGSLYTRSNSYSVSGITSQGVSTGLSSSTPQTLLTSKIAMSWNILDFGMGYVKAKQQGDRVLMAYEESRRQLQQLSQDVLVAYWVAYSIQQLIEETQSFQDMLKNSRETLNVALKDKLVPKENILNYQAALLDGDRKLIELQYKYDKAMLDLKHLLFLPVDEKVILAAPPEELFKAQQLEQLDLRKLDIVTLVYHPQLRGQNYQERLAKFGLKTVLLQALPGITFNVGENYESNKFLLNNKWLDKSIDVAWNLLNLASLPASYRTADMQVKYEKIKSMAITMAALIETRYAYKRYIDLNQEYQLAHQQTQNAMELYNLYATKKSASAASEQQVVLAKLKYVLAKLDEDLLQSDLAVTLGQLYLSVGADLIPQDTFDKPYFEVKTLLEKQIQRDDFLSFIDKKYQTITKNFSVATHTNISRSNRYTIQVAASSNLKDIKNYKNKLQSKRLQVAKVNYQGKSYFILA
ncbi:MAG: TolC family protein, partial [Gammaproteobacteria bacterium]|nr:TolC family protein [Gammaproteobacteria bacterium]